MTEMLDRKVGTIPFDELPHWREARKIWLDYRKAAGRVGYTPLLTDPDHQPKAAKNTVPTWVLHLAPADLSGFEVCPWRTAGCTAACLNTAGRGSMDTVQAGRVLRTRFLADHPAAFLSILGHEIGNHVGRHGKIGVRLNGTSDLRWERIAPWLFDIFGDLVTYYDYTKASRRPGAERIDNYHLTYSASERDSWADIGRMADRFGRVTVVYDLPTSKVDGKYKHRFPLYERQCNLPIIDGDATDWRLEPGPVVIGLRAKGDAKGDDSGFVRECIG